MKLTLQKITDTSATFKLSGFFNDSIHYLQQVNLILENSIDNSGHYVDKDQVFQMDSATNISITIKELTPLYSYKLLLSSPTMNLVSHNFQTGFYWKIYKLSFYRCILL